MHYPVIDMQISGRHGKQIWRFEMTGKNRIVEKNE
jgi:hypothetical protein